MRTKTIAARIKAVGDATDDTDLGLGQFTAYASIFGNVDAYGEIVEKGAFANTLDDWKGKDAPIPLYWAHQMSASPTMNLGHILTAEEDDTGLLVSAQLDIEANPEAKYVYELLKSKRVNQMSFAYDVLGYSESADNDYITLTELKLHEVSVVPVGANQETEVLDVKALVEAEVSRVTGKAGRSLSAKNESAIRSAITALEDVLLTLKTVDSDSDQDDGKAIAPAFLAIEALTGRK